MAGRARLLWWIGAAAAVLLAGCAADESSGPSDTEASPNPVVLRYTSFMLDSSETASHYFEAIAKFEEMNPDIRIEVDHIQNINYTAGLKTRLLGGEQMDVFDVWSPSLFEELRRLDERVYLDLSEEDFLNDFLPATLEPVTKDGRVYGVPGLMHTDGLLYNKTMFRKFGLSVPRTWDELIQLCEKLKAQGIIPIALNSEWWVPQFFFGSLMSNAGADEIWTANLEQGMVRTDHPTLVEAMKMTKEIIDRGFVPEDWKQLKHEQSRDLIVGGRAAMIVTGTWDLSGLNVNNSGQEIDFMMVPGEERTVPNLNIGSYKVVSASSEHPEEAKRFLAYMNGKEMQEKLANGVMAVPSVNGALLHDPIVRRISELVTSEEAMIYWPHIVTTESLQLEMIDALNEYLRGADLARELAKIQLSIDRAGNRETEPKT
ncbi:ABC transporter substrate-binding protein [Paenibacillus harenae]|uniref:Raffinose/stachyose/melibiose transport system substrate-binding protein n=1 Tax=Paenibacillus harenae TaxID=306543 RepID=A0ABT9U381_PAEHA|nr:extracellular solute-binding protein [Paenibacillus harenae]MDQ0061891.1 raffinose/stachyose/melibiose transport system substrate-binding protein [Paenibacillus harenae]MDQ0113516.1 raffinose/stachyose/melibiose transport system substrate-binding protein [Paenibacillus harenae]